ncbi:MAG: hypothetical protein M3442_11035 [Chloroflexota bacterium]|nr:hypothetical protein [Chloroflexota bacterium]
MATFVIVPGAWGGAWAWPAASAVPRTLCAVSAIDERSAGDAIRRAGSGP